MNMPDYVQIIDGDSFQEFVDDLAEQIPRIERNIAQLRRAPSDHALIADLFRALHNVKGNAAICQVDIGVAITHPVETVLARMRDGEIAFSDLLAEAILLAMDRLELALEMLTDDRSLAPLKLPELIDGLERLARARPETVADHAARLIEAVTGFLPAAAAPDVTPHASTIGLSPDKVAADLRFFRSLALQFETRSPLFGGRSQRLLHFALETNEAAGRPVDPTQLEAAVYMHDIGMMFLPESVWLKIGKLSEQDKRWLHGHPDAAAGLLERMAGWQTAAEMVAQHHEMPDRGGYPKGLGTEEICAGAKILAIVDAYEAVSLKHSHRGQSLSIIRAVAEVNACDNQFAPEWIAPFNSVIRRMVEG